MWHLCQASIRPWMDNIPKRNCQGVLLVKWWVPASQPQAPRRSPVVTAPRPGQRAQAADAGAPGMSPGQMRDSAVSLFGSSEQLPGETPRKSKVTSREATIYPGFFPTIGHGPPPPASWSHPNLAKSDTPRPILNLSDPPGTPPAHLSPRRNVRGGAKAAPQRPQGRAAAGAGRAQGRSST